MASSKKTFTVTLHVTNAEKLMKLYGHRIGKDKEFPGQSQALNDLLSMVFADYWDDVREKR